MLRIHSPGVSIAGLLAASLAAAVLPGASAYAVAGGSPAAAGSFAFTTKLDVGEVRSCTGALVSPQWVLTASTCFADGTTPPKAGAPAVATTATIGRTDLSGTAGQVLTVTDLVPNAERGVVLAKLAAPATATPVTVSKTAPADGEILRVAGYGRTATEWVPDLLNTAAFAVQGVSATTLGLVGQADASTCKGDAGAPAFRESTGGAELVALSSTSWQHGCFGTDEARQGGTAIRVDGLTDWIRQSTSGPADVSGLTEFTAGDFNGDHIDDVIAVETSTGKLFLYPGTGTRGVFGARVMIGRSSWNHMHELTAMNFNGDAYTDLATVDDRGVPDGTLYIYPGHAPDSPAPDRISIGNYWGHMHELTAGNWTGGPVDDLIGRDDRGNELWRYPGTANGMGGRVSIGSSSWINMSRLTSLKLNRDAYDDLVTVDGRDNKLWLYPGAAPGTTPPGRTTVGTNNDWNHMTLTAGEFTADGYEDLVAVDDRTPGKLWVYPGTATGGLGARELLRSLS